MLRIARPRTPKSRPRTLRRSLLVGLEPLECRRVLAFSAASPLAAAAPGDWTVMVYMTATDLYENAPGNIEAMERLALRLPPTVKIVVDYDQYANRNPEGEARPKIPASSTTTYATGDGSQPAWSTAGIGVVQGDAHAAELDQRDNPTRAVAPRIATTFDVSPTEVNTGSTEALANFIVQAAQLAPARHYALILWDHGGGVASLNNDDYDTLPDGDLTTSKVIAALQDGRARGISLDLLAYDECLMATVEGAYRIGDLAPVTVASEELVDGPGYNYHTALGVLATNPAQVDAATLARSMVASFGARYVGQNESDTLSAVTDVGVRGVASALKNFVTSTEGARPRDWAAIAAARAGSPDYGVDNNSRTDYYDLGSFMTKLAAGGASPTIRAAASAVANAVDSAVFARTDDRRNSRGESIYFPGAKAGTSSAYAAEARPFLDATGWGRFLARFAATGDGRNPERSVGWADNHDGPTSALNLGTQVGSTPRVRGLVLPGGGQDWYRFSTLATGGARDSVRLDGPGAGRMILTLIDAASGSTVATGRGAVRLAGLPAGDYLLSAARAQAGPATPYALRVVAPKAAVDIPAANDSPADAEDLGTVVHARLAGGLNLAGRGESSWFRFEAPRSDVPIRGAATVLSGGGPLRATLYSEDLVPLRTARGRQALRLAYGDTGGADAFYIRVTGRPTAYSIYFADSRAARD